MCLSSHYEWLLHYGPSIVFGKVETDLNSFLTTYVNSCRSNFDRIFKTDHITTFGVIQYCRFVMYSVTTMRAWKSDQFGLENGLRKPSIIHLYVKPHRYVYRSITKSKRCIVYKKLYSQCLCTSMECSVDRLG